MSDFAAALPKQLSGGMRQRVGIARALAVRPAIFLMDEPLSALDAQTRELLLDDILALWERDHPTILYVTHNFQEAIRIADRVCVLSRRPGRVREIISIPIARAERAKPPEPGRRRRARRAALVADQRGGDRGRSRARGPCLSRRLP